MSNQDYPTWTDEQLQAQLDAWREGTMPDVIATITPNPDDQYMTYLLQFEGQTIQLTNDQASLVDAWMKVLRFKHNLTSLSEQMGGKAPEQSPRDTQFAGFAQALIDELLATYWLDHMANEFRHWEDSGVPEIRTIIARRAYDLVTHACKIHHDYDLMKHACCCSDSELKLIPPVTYMLERIPDLAELPEEEKQ